jgi:hypothetical protein
MFNAANSVVVPALVVVRHRSGAALLHRQPGLGAIERLDLALLVDRQHQGLVRRIEVKAHDVLYLLDESTVARDLERFDAMRLELVRFPYPLNARARKTGRGGHAAYAPVGGIRRLLVQGLVHHRIDLLRCQRFAARRAGRILDKPVHANSAVAPSPAPYGQNAFPDRRGDRIGGHAFARRQHDPRSPHHLLGRIAVRHQLLQPLPIGRGYGKPFDLAHHARFARSNGHVNRPSGTEH